MHDEQEASMGTEQQFHWTPSTPRRAETSSDDRFSTEFSTPYSRGGAATRLTSQAR